MTRKRCCRTNRVNLDEEAAKMIQYQQNYQAAARCCRWRNLCFRPCWASWVTKETDHASQYRTPYDKAIESLQNVRPSWPIPSLN